MTACMCVCVLGVAWGCRWVYEDNGVWKETCYCDDRDGCNSAPSTLLSKLPFTLVTMSLVVTAVMLLQRIV